MRIYLIDYNGKPHLIQDEEAKRVLKAGLYHSAPADASSSMLISARRDEDAEELEGIRTGNHHRGTVRQFGEDVRHEEQRASKNCRQLPPFLSRRLLSDRNTCSSHGSIRIDVLLRRRSLAESHLEIKERRLELTSRIVSAYLSRNVIPVGELPHLSSKPTPRWVGAPDQPKPSLALRSNAPQCQLTNP